MADKLEAIHSKISEYDAKLPHCSNLETKISAELSKKSASRDKIIDIAEKYELFHQSLEDAPVTSISEWLDVALAALADYFQYIYDEKIFVHQSDFTSSVMPEFMCMLYNKNIIPHFPDIIVETQKDIMIDVSFVPMQDQKVLIKSKRVDVALLQSCTLVLNEETISNFNIPIVAVENKTNLDKNMISGIEYSVERLKKTFPLCKYYVLSELSDFAIEKQNYASTAIDEILILRKQKRSQVRCKGGTRNSVDKDLLEGHFEEIYSHLEVQKKKTRTLQERYGEGKLIGNCK